MADRIILAGLPFTSASTEQLAAWIAARRRGAGCATLVCASVEFVVHASRDPQLAATLRDAAVLAPGSRSFVWLSRLVGRALPAHVAGDDLILNIAEQSAHNCTQLALLMDSQTCAARAARALTDRFADLSITASEFSLNQPALLDHLRNNPADVYIIASSRAAESARLICSFPDELPAGACVLITDPVDLDVTVDALHHASHAGRSSQRANRPGQIRRALMDALAFAPVVLHEWKHLIGMREATLSGRPAVNAEQAALPPTPPPESDFAPRTRLKRLFLISADMAILGLTFITADWLRCRLWQHQAWPQPRLNPQQSWYWYLWAVPVLMAIWPAILASFGLYRTALPPPTWRWQRAGAAAAILFLFFSTLALFFSRYSYSRMLILLTTLLAPAGFIAGRFALVAAARTRRWFNDLGLPDYSSY